MAEEEKPKLASAKFEFTQDGNCVDGGYESLEIRMESSLGIDNDEGAFYVLKTEQWAINDLSDLQDLFDRINKILPDGKS
jgi:hypothetical protein